MKVQAFNMLKKTIRKIILDKYEARLKQQIKQNIVPKHLGLILDGNRRFAKLNNLNKSMGHSLGAKKAHDVLGWCLEMNIKAVTIWVLSTDNKNREKEEIGHILNLLREEAIKLSLDNRIHSNKVKVQVIGQHEDFPKEVKMAIKQLEEMTANYDNFHLNIAVGYGGREEIIDAVKEFLLKEKKKDKTLTEAINSISAEKLSQYMYTAGIPDPDFIIRTSGELRLSGFMLWQSVYSEYHFCDVNWPSFRKVDFLRALRDFQGRSRRFGK